MAAIPPKDNVNSWSVAVFETYRPLLTTFLKTKVLPLLDAAECRRVLIRAPVKSGKREMVEYLAVRDHANNPLRVHAFVSAFHRVADQEQRNELDNHNMKVFSLTTKLHADRCCAWINSHIAAGKQVVVHIDECDFGAGHRQILSKVYQTVRNRSEVTTILYSATPQEILFSGEVEEAEFDEMVRDFFNVGERLEYTPPETFCGPQRFLAEGLIQEAQPFFHKEEGGLELSDQGVDIMAALYAEVEGRTGRNIFVLRLSYSDLGGSQAQRKDNKAIYQFLRGWQSIIGLEDCVVIVDKSEKDIPAASNVLQEKICWSDRNYWRTKTKEIPIILVIDQTSSRSTEWACHDRVLAYHDFRNTIVFSTISQAQERVNHYSSKYGGFQAIQVFGHLNTFRLSAGQITYEQYLHYDWEARKLDRRTTGVDEPLYQIRSTAAGHAPHPRFPLPVTRALADRALQELGCFAEIKVSQRVKGSAREVPVFEALFFPCTPATFLGVRDAQLARFGRVFNNPFDRSEREGLENGKWKGYLREWKVFDFERDVKTQPGWGVGPDEPRLTICYRGEELGIALRRNTGRTRSVNTLTAFNSMYSA